MANALVRCPQTQRLERVEYVATPLGPLLRTCSRFAPATAMRCTRPCAHGVCGEVRDAVLDDDPLATEQAELGGEG